MKQEKVFRVTLTLEIYGQTTKKGAANFLAEALHVDGLYPHKYPSAADFVEVPAVAAEKTPKVKRG